MRVWNSLRRLFGADVPAKLRNRAGGMAWIKGLDSGDGDHVLNGRAVRTVRVEHDPVGMVWIIDPPQHFKATANILYTNTSQLVRRGDEVSVIGMPDECLEPWKDIGDGQDESLWCSEPTKAPRPEILALPVREM